MGGADEDARTLEDFEVGQVFTTQRVTVDKADLVAFAKLYDPQPMHTDEEVAKSTFFGELMGSGWQTLGLTMRLVVEARTLGSTPLVGIAIDEVRFHRPLRPGDTLWARVEITEVCALHSKPDRGFLRMKVNTFVGVDTPLASLYWTLLVPRR